MSGFISFNAMTSAFRNKGFRVTSQLEGGNGHRLSKTYSGGLVVEIEMWNPKSFADHVDRALSNQTSAGHLLERLHRELAASPRDQQLAALLERVLAQPGVPAHWHKARLAADVRPFAAVHLRRGDLELRMFTMLTTLGTPLDVTAEELRIESYFPADDASESVLRGWAS